MHKAMPASSSGSTSHNPRSDPRERSSANPTSPAGEPAWRFGSELRAEGGVIFRLFAPAVSSVQIATDEDALDAREPLVMRSLGDGWHELTIEDAGLGTLYRFVLPDGSRVPDPVSRYAPAGVHGPSEVVDPNAFQWSDEEWHGRPWNEAVLYELHVGTLTPEGTFRAAIERLDHLKDLGITAVELMCICAFAGQRSWGYDGVQIYAPNSTYGRPEDLKALIDAAHARGIMVILDVVYNHFGPEGNYIPRYFPQIFSQTHKTAWGPGLNFDGSYSREVRDFIVLNAIYWTREFHVDGLRLDASHAMIDTGPHHILNEIAERVHAAAGDRRVHLILEDEQNIARLLKRDARADAPYAAQWNHAIDHMLGLSMGGDCDPADPNRRHETEELARALAEGFFSGGPSWPPSDRGSVPTTGFVSFIQTHDLVGNRVFGERIHALARPEAVRAVAAIYLLLPQIPMLFMGEEWAATTPFPFFSDYGGELGEAVRRGRAEQLAKTGHTDEATLQGVPDPQAESTFLSAKLNWGERNESSHVARLDWYQRVIAARRERILPLLDGLEPCGTWRVHSGGQFECEWRVTRGGRLRLWANLCVTAADGFDPAGTGEVLWLEGSQPDPRTLGSWSALWTLE